MNENKSESAKSNTGLLHWAATNRDGFLVTGSGIYILGYLVWSLHAFQNNLGLLPAIESQYFLAGVIPSLILWGIYSFIKNQSRISTFLFNYFKSGEKGIRRVVRWMIIVLLTSTFAVYLVTVNWSAALRSWFSPIWNERPITIISLWLIYPLTYLVIHIIFSRIFFKEERNPISASNLFRFAGYVNSVIFALFALGMYIYWIYPRLPQEFGGVQPRCAYVDIASDQISATTRASLTTSNPNVATPNILRSVNLNVFFLGKDTLLVKVLGSQDNKVIELSRTAAPVIIWCR